MWRRLEGIDFSHFMVSYLEADFRQYRHLWICGACPRPLFVRCIFLCCFYVCLCLFCLYVYFLFQDYILCDSLPPVEDNFDLDLAWAVANGYMPIPEGLVPLEEFWFGENLDLPPLEHPNPMVPALPHPDPAEGLEEPVEPVPYVCDFPPAWNNIVFDIHVPEENLAQLPFVDNAPEDLDQLPLAANVQVFDEDLDLDQLPPAPFHDNFLNEIEVMQSM